MMFSWIAILVGIVSASVYFGDGKFRTAKEEYDPSPDSLKDRYAKGEVNGEEYGERKAVLEEEENYT